LGTTTTTTSQSKQLLLEKEEGGLGASYGSLGSVSLRRSHSGDGNFASSFVSTSSIPRRSSNTFCKRLFALLALFASLILIGFLWSSGVLVEKRGIESSMSGEGVADDDSEKRSFRIVLFGDSLINVPCRDYQLVDKLRALLPTQYKYDISWSANSGECVASFRGRLHALFGDGDEANRPDMVLMHWDSDVSDINEDAMNAQQVAETRALYERNLDFVVENLKSNVSFFALGGPGLLGEGPLFQPKRYDGKAKMLEVYKQINERICQQHQVVYIDFRTAFQQALPWYYVLNRGYVTTDGIFITHTILSSPSSLSLSFSIILSLSLSLRKHQQHNR